VSSCRQSIGSTCDIGMEDFTAPGQVRWSIEGSETVVWINTDGDLTADAAIPERRCSAWSISCCESARI